MGSATLNQNAIDPRVAVLIVTWNPGVHLARCIGNLKDQTLRPHKIIVIDNASSDGSLEALAPDLVALIEIVRMESNIGFAAANNRGLDRVGECGWVALLNPDAFPEVDWLEQLLQAVHANPEYQIVSSRQLMARQPDRLDGAGDDYHVSGLHWRRGYGETSGNYSRCEEVFSPCAAAALYRMDAVREIGGFDENFFCYAEDVDLGFRLRLRGYRCIYAPNAVVHHVGSAVTGKGSDFTVYYAHRNLVWAYLKNMPPLLLWVYSLQHLMLNLIEMVWFTLRGQGRVILKAKWDALRGLPRVWRQRKEIQRTRSVPTRELWRVMTKGILKPYLRRLPRV